MIYVTGDLFESHAQVLVNPVNIVGVMGKGIAREFKHRYPDMFEQYKRFCESGQFQIGSLWLYEGHDKRVLNFPTKCHWRQPSRVTYITAGLESFVYYYKQWDIHSIAFPMLGCGNGQLNWEAQVKPTMEHYLSELSIEVYVYCK